MAGAHRGAPRRSARHGCARLSRRAPTWAPAAHHRTVRVVEAVGQLGAARDSHPRAAGESQRAGTRSAASCPHRDGSAQNARSVVIESEPEGLGQTPGSAGDPAKRARRIGSGREAAKPSHRLQPLDGLGRPQQDRSTAPAGFADEIQAGVNAVAAVGVNPPRDIEHALVSLRPTNMRMRCRIAPLTQVRLDLDEPARQPISARGLVHEDRSDQVPCDVETGPIEEATRQPGAETHPAELSPGDAFFGGFDSAGLRSPRAVSGCSAQVRNTGSDAHRRDEAWCVECSPGGLREGVRGPMTGMIPRRKCALAWRRAESVGAEWGVRGSWVG